MSKKNNKKEAFNALYGGFNTEQPPFNVGDIIKQKYTLDDNNNLIKDGKEMYEFVGMDNDMMLLKSLNEDAAYSKDTVNPEVTKMAVKAGYKPTIGDITMLHYMYGDRFETI